jgi:NADH-ubiquinone oxidoreductase chain 1
MTEHAAVIFVFFFLAEYASIVLISVLTSILFLGGYCFNYLDIFNFFYSFIQYINFDYYINNLHNESILNNPLIEGLFYGITLGIKSFFLVFVFI